MLNKETIIRAWKDAAFRESLNEEVRMALPAHPSGLVTLTDEELGSAVGGSVLGCSTALTQCFDTLSGFTCGPCSHACSNGCGGGGGSHEPGCQPNPM